jgi:transposase
MRQAHRVGEKLFVDYAGQTMPVIDPRTGEIRSAQIFVAVLGGFQLHLCRSDLDAIFTGLDWFASTQLQFFWWLA